MSHFILPHNNAKPLFAVLHDAVLPFVTRAFDEWKIDHDRAAPCRLAAQTINPASTLFDRAGIPREIMMDHMTTEPLKIHAFSA